MARRLIVEIIGDASSLERATGKAEAATGRLGGTFNKLSGVAKLAGVAIAAGVAVGLEKSVHAAIEAQTATARLNTAFAASHVSAKAYAGGIEDAEKAGNKLGFTNTDVKQSLGSLIIATHDGGKALKDLGVAQDIARFKGIDLTSASKMLTMAMAGSQRATKQLGITVPAVTTAYDALKATVGKTIDPTEKLALAHAKLVDKMSTSNAVIATVSEKLHGQAQAFADTAAGGMAQFHASLETLEEKIGTALLPTLTKATGALTTFVQFLSNSPGVAKAASEAMQVFKDVIDTVVAAGKLLLDWYQKHQSSAKILVGVLAALAIAFAGPIVTIVAVGVALIELYKHSETAREIMRAAFDAIRDKINQVMPTIKSIITQTVTAVEAIWNKFGGMLTSVAKTAAAATARIIGDLVSVIGGVFNLIGDLIHGRWAKVWGDLKQIVSHALDAVVTAVKAEIQIVFTAAVAIGKALVEGILSGLEGLAKSVGDKIASEAHGAISSAKSFLGIGSPSKMTADELGQPMAEGVVMGWILGTASLPSKMKQSMQDAITAARTAIQAAQGTFQTAFGGLVSVADSALDALDAKIQTKSEKALAKLTAAHDAAAQAAQILTARNDLASAKGAAEDYMATAGGTPEQIQAATDATTKLTLAQDALNAAVAKYGGASDQAAKATLAVHAAQDAVTKAQAATGVDPGQEAALNQAVVQAQQTLDDLLYQKHVAALQKKADAERLNLNATLAIQKQHFDAQLAALQAALTKHGATAATATEDVLKLLAAYGINFKNVGQDMGIAWIQGLKDALGAAARGAGKLSGTITDAANSITVPKRAAGGPVSAGSAYLVGERGPELFVPGTSGGIVPNGGGGGRVVHNHFVFSGAVGSKQQIQAWVVEAVATANRQGALRLADLR